MNATLKYELERLESIISNNLSGAREKNVHFTVEQSADIKEILREEVERIKKKFVHEIFAFEDERHLERYIQFHQQELIRITDDLADRNKEVGPGIEFDTLDYSELSQYAYNSAEELLGFIERHFTKYFDQDMKAPESYIVLTGSEVVKSFGALQDQLKKLETDSYLMDLVLNPVKKFIENIPNNQITYRRIIYVKEVQKELIRVISTGRIGNDINEDIRLVLLYLNYNSIKYFRYYTNHINTLLNEIDSSSGRIEKLSYVLKMINQTQVKPGVGYNRTMRTLKDQLSDWVTEEIFYLEKMHHMNEKHAIANGTLAEDFKLRTEMPVSQLA